jgi:hypothetical protein
MFESLIPTPGIIIGSIIAGLTVAAILAYFNKRRLFVIVPRLFSYSEFSSGQMIEITILNGGRKSEEDVEVQLSPKFSYTLIATTLPSLELTERGFIKLRRLAKGENVGVVLSAEGGDFSQDSVISVTSKTTKGEVKKKIEESQEASAVGAAIAFLFIFVAMPLCGYYFGNIFVDEILPEIRPASKIEAKIIKELKAAGWEGFDKYLMSLETNGNTKVWPIAISFPYRTGEFLNFKVDFENNSFERSEYSVSLSSSFDVSEYTRKTGYAPDFLASNIILLPSQKASRTLEVYLPFKATTKLVIFDFFVEKPNETYHFKYIWQFDGGQ